MTEATEAKIIEKLIATNEEFKKLHDEHHSMDEQVRELFTKRVGSPSDELEISRLKKLKLASKDKMRKIIAEAEAQVD